MIFRKKKKGITFSFREPAIPIFDKDGKQVGIRGMYTDEEFQREAEKARMEEYNKVRHGKVPLV